MTDSSISGAVDKDVAEEGAEDQHQHQDKLEESPVAKDAGISIDDKEESSPVAEDAGMSIDAEEESPVVKDADVSIDDTDKSKASGANGAEKPLDKLLLRYQEVEGDLFQCPSTSSLAHCVSKDLCMSKGIATFFKANFGRVNELKRQAKTVGECAVLKFPDRHIYYLITKRVYSHKPTYPDLEASLIQMKEHCQANGVKELSMPQIGCGLDRLAWNRVSQMIQEVFADVDISITVYIFVKRRR